jgi:hypothetical protein
VRTLTAEQLLDLDGRNRELSRSSRNVGNAAPPSLELTTTMTNTYAGIHLAILTAALGCGELLTGQGWLPPSPYPSWGATTPATIFTINYDPTLPPVANGARLHVAILGLLPGQGLAIGPGTWTVPSRLDLSGVGTPQAPYWLFAAIPSQRPVITRPNAAQNAVNMGSVGPARYWVLRDLEITTPIISI